MLLLQPTTTQHPNLQIRRPSERYPQLTKKTRIKTRKKTNKHQTPKKPKLKNTKKTKTKPQKYKKQRK